MISLDAGFKAFSVSRRTTMTPEIIPYTLGDSGDVSRSSRKQYSRTPWRAYHPQHRQSLLSPPQTVQMAKEKGGSGYCEAVTPGWRCHHLPAALNTRWFIHESSLTTITLIRLINGRCRARSVPQEHLQRYSNGRYISEAYTAKTPASSRFSSVVDQKADRSFSLTPTPYHLQLQLLARARKTL